MHAYVESWRYFEVVLNRLPPSMHGYAPTQWEQISLLEEPLDRDFIEEFVRSTGTV